MDSNRRARSLTQFHILSAPLLHAASLYTEGAQTVHISTKYTIMLSCTRLHVYIRASLIMYVRSRRLPTIMTSSLHGVLWRVRKIHRKRCYIFVHFSSTPTSILNLLHLQKANKTTFPTIHCPYGNILNFSRTSRIQYVIPPIQTNGTECARTHTHAHTQVKT